MVAGYKKSGWPKHSNHLEMEKYFEWVINKIWMNYHLFIFFYYY